MKVYIAGPITGIPEHNKPAFEMAAALLRANGHEPVNPHDLCSEGTPWSECMRVDIRAMLDCDAVALLDGWESSRGASMEQWVGHRCGLKVQPLYWFVRADKGRPQRSASRYLASVPW